MSPLLADGDRTAYMGGLSYHTDRFRFDIAYEQVDISWTRSTEGQNEEGFDGTWEGKLPVAPHERHPQVLKRRTPMKKTVFAISLVALLAVAPAMAQVDFSNYVALGDSMTAGFASASMMNWYQDRSYPAVLAQQAGVPDFEQPYISEPGIGPIFELVSLAPTPVIQPVGLVPGLPTNATYPGIYNNLGIPTATLYDMIFQTGDINNLIQGNFDTVFFDIVLRNGINTALEQAIGMQPSFMTVWIGSNDVLASGIGRHPDRRNHHDAGRFFRRPVRQRHRSSRHHHYRRHRAHQCALRNRYPVHHQWDPVRGHSRYWVAGTWWPTPGR